MPSEQARHLDWPAGYDRTDRDDREPYPGDLSPTRKESFQSVVDELERWGATSVDIATASQHYADRPNIPHQHDKPDDVGVVVRFRHEDEAAARQLKAAAHPDSGGDRERYIRIAKAEEAMLDGE